MDWIDPELLKRAARILAKLSILSEAHSSDWATSFGHHGSDGSPPIGVRFNRDSSKPPSKDDHSLYEWYSWHFARAGDDQRWRILCYLAERDYERYRRRPDDSKRGPITLRGKDGNTAENEGMKRVVEWYEGMDPLEVAILDECSVEHIKKARRIHRRDEETGLPKPGWYGWDDERRVIEVRQRRAKGWGQKKVADDIGVSKRTIQRIWEHAAVPPNYSRPVTA